MNNKVQEFYDGVKKQAIASGQNYSVSEAVAASAVLSRLSVIGDGYAIAQTANFPGAETKLYKFTVQNISVDQALNKGTVIEAILASPEEDIAGQSFTIEALTEFAAQINATQIGGFVDEHSQFRNEGKRSQGSAVTEWIRARIQDGRLWITTKLKDGFEWVADTFDALSLEAFIPKTRTLVTGNKKTFLGGGIIKGFVFTNNPKQPLNRIVDVVSDL